MECNKVREAIEAAHDEVTRAEQEAEALKRPVGCDPGCYVQGTQLMLQFFMYQVTDRELQALEAMSGSAVLERFGIEAELGDVLTAALHNNTSAPTSALDSKNPRLVAFGMPTCRNAGINAC